MGKTTTKPRSATEEERRPGATKTRSEFQDEVDAVREKKRADKELGLAVHGEEIAEGIAAWNEGIKEIGGGKRA